MKHLFFSIMMMAGNLAFAANPQIEGRIYSSNECGYFTTTLGDFRVTYTNQDLAWGTRIFVHMAFHDQVYNTHWSKPFEMEMKAVAGFTWQAEADQITVVSRGEYYADDLEFVFEIIRPDGTRVWDNGGAGEQGHYASSLKSLHLECAPGGYLNMETHPAR